MMEEHLHFKYQHDSIIIKGKKIELISFNMLVLLKKDISVLVIILSVIILRLLSFL